MTQQRRPRSQGLRHVALRVKDMAAMRDFYTRILGFKTEWEPDPDNLYLSSGTDNLALHRESEDFSRGALDHIGLLVPAPADVDDWASYLKASGVSLKQEPKTHRDGARSIYLADPDGNVIQIIFHPPISGKS